MRYQSSLSISIGKLIDFKAKIQSYQLIGQMQREEKGHILQTTTIAITLLYI